MANPLSDPETLNRALHGLSMLHPHSENRNPSPLHTPPHRRTQKHISLLNDIALLLTFTTGKGESVATSIIDEPGRKTVLWAKNEDRPLTIAQKTNVNRMIWALKLQKNASECLDLVISACKQKIISRCKKIHRAFCPNVGESRLLHGCRKRLDINDTHAYYSPLSARLRTPGLLTAEAKLECALNQFAHRPRNFGPAHTYDDECLLRTMMAIAYVIDGHEPGSDFEPIFNAEQMRRISKLARYSRAVSKLRYTFRRRSICESEIDLRQITSPSPQILTLPASLIPCLNTWVQAHPDEWEPIKSLQQLKKDYHYRPPKAPRSMTDPEMVIVRATQHPELTLALHLLRDANNSNTNDKDDIYPPFTKLIKIGVNKATCHWCRLYTTSLNEVLKARNVELFVNNRYGGRGEGWLVPQKVSKEVLGMKGARKVEEEFLEHVRVILCSAFREMGLGKPDCDVDDPRLQHIAKVDWP